MAAAIAAASNGDTILIEEGATLYENIGVINKDLTIRTGTALCIGVSTNPATIDGSSGDSVIDLVNADVTLQDIILSNGTAVGASPRAGGVTVSALGTLTLIDSTVQYCTNAFGFVLPPLAGAGVHVFGGGTLLLQGQSVISGNNSNSPGPGGIFIDTGGTAIIEDDSMVGIPILGPNSADVCCGGGVWVKGTMTVSDQARIHGNTSAQSAGGVYLDDGTMSLLGSAAVSYNTADGTALPGAGGGGIRIVHGGVLTANGDPTVMIEGNVSDHRGGGIQVRAGTADLTETTLRANESALCGGGIHSQDVVDLFGVTIDANDSDSCGGGLAALDGSVEALQSVFSANVAATDGGGIHIDGDDVVFDAAEVSIEDNAAAGDGGGIAVLDASWFDLFGVDFTGNSADGDGGGLLLDATGLPSTLTDVRLDDNDATDGAGIAITAAYTVDLSVAELTANDATGRGGGMAVIASGSLVDLTDVLVTDNTADLGGGLFLDSGDLTLRSTDLLRNVADTEGGGLRQRGGVLYHEMSLVNDNDAGTLGGGGAYSGGTTTLVRLDITQNTAGLDGGGLAIAYQGNVSLSAPWLHDNVASGRGGGLAVLSSGPSTDPQLYIVGAQGSEGCQLRTPGFNEYCSEIRGNLAAGGGGGAYFEDGTSTIETTAFLDNDTYVSGSAIGMVGKASTGGDPTLTLDNAVIALNGSGASIDVVRVQDATLLAQHVTSADNTGTPFRFSPGSGASLLQRSIQWDSALVQIDPSLTIGATCTMFRGTPVGGATSGFFQAVGLDPFFVTTGRGDYRLDGGSINAINKCTTGLPYDIDGNPRSLLYDRGAFEAP